MNVTQLSFLLTQPAEPLPQGYSSLIRRIDIADQEVRIAIHRHPEKAELLNGSFMTLTASASLDRPYVADMFYRSHCRQTLGRIVAGQNYNYATDAEMLLYFSRASAHVQFSNEGRALYAYLFLQACEEIEAHFREMLTQTAALNSVVNGNRKLADELEAMNRFRQIREPPKPRPFEESDE
jgi:hypothetical protein